MGRNESSVHTHHHLLTLGGSKTKMPKVMHRSTRAPESLRIAVVGDFSGNSDREEGESAVAVARRVDCDSFAALFERIAPTLDLPAWMEDSNKSKLRLHKLDDFHPDRLLEELEPLSKLVQIRSRLQNPGNENAAARELEEFLNRILIKPEAAAPSPTESAQEMVERLLGKSSSDHSRVASPILAIDHLIKGLVAPKILATASPRQAQLVALAESELSDRLRKFLHDPEFQALESTWRGLDFLVRSIGDEVELFLINIRKSELAHASVAEDVSRSAIDKQLREIQPAVVLGIYTFDQEDGDALKGIGNLAGRCQAAFISGASQRLLGCASFGLQPDPDDWSQTSAVTKFESFRRSPEAARVGLVLPRFLLRQPYGMRSDPIEAFPFEEMTANPEHESYLWGNAAFLYGYLLADTFENGDWEPDLAGSGVISGLPIHEYKSDGETYVKPCAEAWLSERAAATIIDLGIMPVLSIRGTNEVRLSPLQSCSNPPGALLR